jgi:hypothetical protein
MLPISHDLEPLEILFFIDTTSSYSINSLHSWRDGIITRPGAFPDYPTPLINYFFKNNFYKFLTVEILF